MLFFTYRGKNESTSVFMCQWGSRVIVHKFTCVWFLDTSRLKFNVVFCKRIFACWVRLKLPQYWFKSWWLGDVAVSYWALCLSDRVKEQVGPLVVCCNGEFKLPQQQPGNTCGKRATPGGMCRFNGGPHSPGEQARMSGKGYVGVLINESFTVFR